MRLYANGKLIGTSTVKTNGSPVTVTVPLNGTGRSLLAGAPSGITITAKATAQPSAGNALTASAHFQLRERHRRLIPGAATFEPNSDQLTRYGRRYLADVASHIHHVASVVCEGFTASVYGPANTAFTLRLAHQRAQVACNYLRAHHLSHAYYIKALGKRDPLAPNVPRSAGPATAAPSS